MNYLFSQLTCFLFIITLTPTYITAKETGHPKHVRHHNHTRHNTTYHNTHRRNSMAKGAFGGAAAGTFIGGLAGGGRGAGIGFGVGAMTGLMAGAAASENHIRKQNQDYQDYYDETNQWDESEYSQDEPGYYDLYREQEDDPAV